jgi:hypothetical protein
MLGWVLGWVLGWLGLFCCNIIVQSSNDPIAVNAANALFNKHPNTSILVKFDQNGNLVTLKGEAYTPTTAD